MTMDDRRQMAKEVLKSRDRTESVPECLSVTNNEMYVIASYLTTTRNNTFRRKNGKSPRGNRKTLLCCSHSNEVEPLLNHFSVVVVDAENSFRHGFQETKLRCYLRKCLKFSPDAIAVALLYPTP
jgi:hypothetical protein